MPGIRVNYWKIETLNGFAGRKYFLNLYALFINYRKFSCGLVASATMKIGFEEHVCSIYVWNAMHEFMCVCVCAELVVFSNAGSEV